MSATATIIAFVAGVPLGAMLASAKFRGSGVLVVIANALLGLPPVVVGLVVYLALSRSGPLGEFGLLFTPAAMIIAQAILGLPIVIALTHRALEPLPFHIWIISEEMIRRGLHPKNIDVVKPVAKCPHARRLFLVQFDRVPHVNDSLFHLPTHDECRAERVLRACFDIAFASQSRICRELPEDSLRLSKIPSCLGRDRPLAEE